MPGSKLKVREVIDHSGQPFKSVCRHLGRCLTLLWKFVCSRPGALESVSMEQLLGFVNGLSGQRVPTSAEWLELDLVEMFPNIPRDKILVAVKHFWSVPFVNRPFESEIHGTVNFTYFCCFLLGTWCHCVLLSCYLRPK